MPLNRTAFDNFRAVFRVLLEFLTPPLKHAADRFEKGVDAGVETAFDKGIETANRENDRHGGAT